MESKRVLTVFTALSISLLVSQKSLANPSGSCIDVYKPKPSTQIALLVPPAPRSANPVAFYPRPENAIMGNESSAVAQRLAEESARRLHKGRSKVYTPDVIGRELYTPSNAPQIEKVYMAHQLLLGDLIRSDLYADAIMKVLADDKIDTPEEITKFVENFHGWKSFNVTASESFLARSAVEFARQLDKFIGEGVDYRVFEDAQTKYGLSIDDLLQLKSNVALLRENNDGNLKISMMLPILADGPNTTKLLKEALVRRNTPQNLAIVPVKTTEVVMASPKGGLAWHWRSIKNLGDKIFDTGQSRFGKLTADGAEGLLKTAERIFKNSRSDFSIDPNFLKNIFVNKENPKSYTLSEIAMLVKKSPGYFFIASSKKNRGFSAIETGIRIRDFIKALPQIRIDKTKLDSEEFLEFQATLEDFKTLIIQTSKSYAEKFLTLESNVIDNMLISDTKAQNEIWEEKMILQISELQKKYTDFYVASRGREYSAYFTAKEVEIINKTRANPRIVKIFDNAARSSREIDSSQFVKLISESNLSADDVEYLVRNYNPERFFLGWRIEKFYEMARLPLTGIVDPQQSVTMTDLNNIFAARLAMSFDIQSQKINLDQFEALFDKFRILGVTENYLGKASLAKFFKSVIGPKPSTYDKDVLELNSTEAYLMLVRLKAPDQLSFLAQHFNLSVDRSKATDPHNPAVDLNGKGTFTIHIWRNGAHSRLNRGN